VENAIGKTKGGFAFWWYNGEGAQMLRMIVMMFLFVGFGCLWYEAKASAIQAEFEDYTTPADLYAPSTLTAHAIETKELAVSETTSRGEFIRLDRDCQLHFVQVRKFIGAGLEVSYVAKPSNESTHVYKFKEFIWGKPVRRWVEIVPLEVEFDKGAAFIRWHHQLKVHAGLLVLSILGLAISGAAAGIYLSSLIKRRWVTKLRPQ
jgi:hypothetical protein